MNREAFTRALAVASLTQVNVLVTPALVAGLEKVQHSSSLTAEESVELQSLYVQLGIALERNARPEQQRLELPGARVGA